MHVSTRVQTPIGQFEISGSELGVRKVQLQKDAQEIKGENLPAEHPVAQCKAQLQAYFEGNLKNFDLKLDWSSAPDFHKKVWAALVGIPFGKTVSYPPREVFAPRARRCGMERGEMETAGRPREAKRRSRLRSGPSPSVGPASRSARDPKYGKWVHFFTRIPETAHSLLIIWDGPSCLAYSR